MDLEHQLNSIGDHDDGHPATPEGPTSYEAQAEHDVMTVRESGLGKDEQRSSITRRETRHGDSRR